MRWRRCTCACWRVIAMAEWVGRVCCDSSSGVVAQHCVCVSSYRNQRLRALGVMTSSRNRKPLPYSSHCTVVFVYARPCMFGRVCWCCYESVQRPFYCFWVTPTHAWFVCLRLLVRGCNTNNDIKHDVDAFPASVEQTRCRITKTWLQITTCKPRCSCSFRPASAGIQGGGC